MSKLKTSTRLFILIGVMAGLLLAIGGLGLFGISKSNAALKTVYEDRTVAIALLGDIQHQLLRSRLAIDSSLLDPTPELIAREISDLASTSATISKAWNSYMATYLTEQEALLASKFAQDLNQYKQEGLLPATVALRTNDIAAAHRLIQDKIRPMDRPLQAGLEDLMTIQIKIARAEYTNAVDRFATLRLVAGSAIAAGLLFALLAALALLRAQREEMEAAQQRQAHTEVLRLLAEKTELMQVLKQQQQTLAESEFRWKFAVEGVGDGVWDRNIQTGEEIYSSRWKAMLGYADEDILPNYQEWESRIHPDDRQAVLASDQAYLAGGTSECRMEFRLRCKDDSYKWILSRGVIVNRNPSGLPLRMIGTHTDISQRKESEERYRLLAKVFKHALEGIMITDLDGNIVEVNQAFTQITGYSRAEVLGRNPRLLNSGVQADAFYAAMWRELSESGNWVGENWNRRKSGEVYAQFQKVSTVRDDRGQPWHYVSLFSDITAEKNHEKELEHLARYDSLTQLPNRALLSERLGQALAQTLRRGKNMAVVFLDLDGFKEVNDQHGHDAGDHLLITLAHRMKQALRDGDILARLGGDEFVAVLLDLENVDCSAPALNRLLAAAAQPVPFNQVMLQVSASLGVTFFPQAQKMETDQLLRQADQAMYQAKQAGKNRFQIFDAEQDLRVRSRHESLRSIERALNKGEFLLAYQPKVNLRTGAVLGAEALIRWMHPERGLLKPAAFLPMIEDHPLAIQLGQWVIENALLQIERWQQDGLNITVSVNIGMRHVRHTDFVKRLRESLAAHPQLRHDCLELELQEACAFGDLAHVSQVIQQCRQIGVECALDDFGSGNSSLTTLKKLPVKYLKIDQSFIRDMLDNSDSLLILIGVLKLASAFDLTVVAEGVETVEHGAMLLQLGCELAQGYGIAQPMPAAELPDWVRNWTPDAAWRDVALVPS
jgi:diguanylate cyclase (GGDEF)-like protein/PAS domain S-box-containing protein